MAQPSVSTGGRIEHWMPGVRALRTYERSWLPRDLIAGIVLVTLLVPQGMAYAELAGLPADHRAVHDGDLPGRLCPRRTVADPDPRPGFVARPDDRRHHPAARRGQPGDGDRARGHARAPRRRRDRRRGRRSSSGSSPTCSRTRYGPGTWPVLPSSSSSASCRSCSASRPTPVAWSPRLRPSSRASDMTNAWALAIGLLSLGIILGLKRLSPRTPGILIAVVVAIALSIVLDLAARGVSVIGVLPQGFPVPSLPGVPIDDIPVLFAAAIGHLAGRDRRHDLGLGRLRGARRLRGGRQPGARRDRRRPTSPRVCSRVSRSARAARGPRSRSSPGAKTQLTGLVAAALVLLMLLFVPGLVQAMPQPVLAAVVIAASISLFDVAELRRLYRVQQTEFWLAVACALGVMFVGVLPGHRHRGRPVGDVHLQARLGAVLGRAREADRGPGLPRHPALSGRRAAPGPAHRSVVGAALLREREPVPRPDPRPREGSRARHLAGSSSRPSRSPTSTRRAARCWRTWTSS